MSKRKETKEIFYKNVEEGNRIEEIEKKIRQAFEDMDGIILDENNKGYYE